MDFIPSCIKPMMGPIRPITHNQMSSSKSGRYMASIIAIVIKATVSTITKCFNSLCVGLCRLFEPKYIKKDDTLPEIIDGKLLKKS